jgi:uncharacterized protein YkwD
MKQRHLSSVQLFIMALVTIIVLGAAMLLPATGGEVAVAAEPVEGQEMTLQDHVLANINEQRAAAGCAPLVQNQQLIVAAQRHAEDMAVRNYLNHTNPEGVTFGQRIINAGYHWGYAGENIGVGSADPQVLINLWMQSQSHRATILDCRMTEVGIGYAYQANDGADVVFPNGNIGGPYFHYWVIDVAVPAAQ